MAWLISLLNGIAGLSGLLFFIALCGCLFVDEAKRQSRMGLAMFGLGSFGIWAAVAEWLESDVSMACESLRRLRWAFCAVVENSPQALQGYIAFAGLIVVLVGSAWLAQTGWSLNRYRALR
ncbi:hypothetical protein [Chitinibacter sp. GC72]|uniref:hypothetical protein n=1 Tax=Chitinibacter sp. GC72 TaxID=1526917 RepID=UPI0012F99F15|nr:hypothetical protein [Chitinibacter sp. GC72]